MTMTIREMQQRVWANKVRQGFNTTDVPTEFCLAMTELGEAFDAWRKTPETLAEELADVLLFVISLAEMNELDLGAAVEAKMAKNERRIYQDGPNGLKVSA